MYVTCCTDQQATIGALGAFFFFVPASGMVDLKNKRCKWVGCAKQVKALKEGLATRSGKQVLFNFIHKLPVIRHALAILCSKRFCP